MLNNITLQGRLTRPPETRYTQTNIPVTSFCVACQRDSAGIDGGQPKTDFINVEAWRSTADFISRYFSTGDMILIQGRLHNEEWTDREGKKRVTAKVVVDRANFCGSKRDKPSPDISAVDFEELDDDSGELPF